MFFHVGPVQIISSGGQTIRMSPAGSVGSTMLRAVGVGGQQISQMGKQIITVKGSPQGGVGGGSQPQIVTLVKTSTGVQIAPVSLDVITQLFTLFVYCLCNLI